MKTLQAKFLFLGISDTGSGDGVSERNAQCSHCDNSIRYEYLYIQDCETKQAGCSCYHELTSGLKQPVDVLSEKVQKKEIRNLKLNPIEKTVLKAIESFDSWRAYYTEGVITFDELSIKAKEYYKEMTRLDWCLKMHYKNNKRR